MATTDTTAVCHFCGPTLMSVRPYGPEGTMICLPCAADGPE